MSPVSRSKSKDKKSGKEPSKTPSKSLSHANISGGIPASGYNPILGTFHALDSAPGSSASSLHANGRFKNIDETDDQSSNSLGTGGEYDTVSNNGSWSGESEDPKEKISHPLPPKQETVPGADNDKREKIRQKNERKHQRQKERRAQELHEKCSGYLMSRKLEALAQQLVSMGFSSERATMALILNEGRVEQSVAWLFEEGQEADNTKHKEHNIDGGGNLKIDISEELSRISEIESRYKCSKQEVERAVVACEGDLEKAEESMRAQKQETTTNVQSKPEETVVSCKLPTSTSHHNSVSLSTKLISSTSVQMKRDEKIPNSSMDPVSKNIQQSLKGVQLKTDWAKPPQATTTSADKRWSGAAIPNPSAFNNSFPSQVSPSPVMTTEARYIAVGNELKNLQLGSIKEPIIVMQRPQQSMNAKQVVPPSTFMSSSPPGGTAARGGWYLHGAEPMKPDRMVTHASGLRNASTDSFNANQILHNQHPFLPHQFQLHQQQNALSNGGQHEPPGTSSSRVNAMWCRTGSTSQHQGVAAASSLGLFSGLGNHGPLGPSPHVDWNSGFSMPHLDYNNIDWSLDSNSSSSVPGGLWPKMNQPMPNNYRNHTFTSRAAMGPILSDGISIPTRLQEGMMASAVETSAGGGGSREWTSPFEEKDLFSLPRQFVSSPSL
ncbi:hypothetical protein DM860_006084 [Cuscuta australis]|uniref:UBA domain-containing protein n=1 Tax=Cuscuta australis TaxID=267555 RepID=A0A328DKZ5_9ASTE|nr:hypothetical protein DM860_006084 [Cuscuta australis]